MSNHKTPLTELERTGLIAHGLGRDIGRPSQLVDVFRQGVAWALANTLPQPQRTEQEFLGKWHKGEPPHPYKTEWFIARTKSRERVVLQALPKEYSYDYTTADETYIMGDQITHWMQFPDSSFTDFEPPQRTWVGLTDEQIEDCYKQGGIGRAIQLFKEKNT